MARTVAEIEAAALELTKLDASRPVKIITWLIVTAEEGALLVKQHQASRVKSGRPVPATDYVTKKLKSGKVHIHGHPVKVEG